MIDALRKMLERDEGIRATPYFDCCGNSFRDCACQPRGRLTVGVGRNLEDVGLSRVEIAILLDADIERARSAAERFHWFANLDEARADVVIAMIFNLGFGGFCKFKQTIAYLSKGDYHLAAREMLNSKWADQVGARAIRLSEMMLTGKYPEGGE